MILTFEKSLYLFVDLSFWENENKPRKEQLLDIVMSYQEAKIILSLFSGDHSKEGLAATTLMNILRHSELVEIKRFTEEEAEVYVDKIGSSLKYNEIKEISGTNPLLLSCHHENHNYGTNLYTQAKKNYLYRVSYEI